MREEKVTINILKWLEKNGWTILCYDFPQSGTGMQLHVNSSGNRSTKNIGVIIPDIIAIRGGVAVFFENKDRFVLADFDKIRMIKTTGNYSQSLDKMLKAHNIHQIYFGIGIPASVKDVKKSMENINGIDFLITTDLAENIFVNYNPFNTF